MNAAGGGARSRWTTPMETANSVPSRQDEHLASKVSFAIDIHTMGRTLASPTRSALNVPTTSLARDIEDHAALLAAGLDRAAFEQRRSLVRLLVATEHGCFVKLHNDGAIEIQGILPTATTVVEMRMMVPMKAG
jgi:hypothetical protein